jgi:hypothetical protein
MAASTLPPMAHSPDNAMLIAVVHKRTQWETAMSSSKQPQAIGKLPSAASAQATHKRVRVVGAQRQNGSWWNLRYPKRVD